MEIQKQCNPFIYHFQIMDYFQRKLYVKRYQHNFIDELDRRGGYVVECSSRMREIGTDLSR